MDDLELNSLHRFKKRSPRLVLETHGSCEVPAGCGGVILRWRDPDAGSELTAYVWSLGSVLVWLDGKPQPRPIWRLTAGSHLLALQISDLPQDGGLLLAAGNAPPLTHHDETTIRTLPTTLLLTSPDRSWRYASVDPGAGWEQRSFDDAGWATLEPRVFSEPEGHRQGLWTFNRASEVGATGLAPEGSPTEIWVRKRFEVTHA